MSSWFLAIRQHILESEQHNSLLMKVVFVWSLPNVTCFLSLCQANTLLEIISGIDPLIYAYLYFEPTVKTSLALDF